MSNKIKHSGVVDGVDGTTVRVRILQSSACSACKVASHCNASETKEKLVEVTTSDASQYHVGDSVRVLADTSVGFRASWYGYLLPLVLMVVALVTVLKVSGSEGMGVASTHLTLPTNYSVKIYVVVVSSKTTSYISVE